MVLVLLFDIVFCALSIVESVCDVSEARRTKRKGGESEDKSPRVKNVLSKKKKRHSA